MKGRTKVKNPAFVPTLKPLALCVKAALRPLSVYGLALAVGAYPSILLSGPEGGVVMGGAGSITQSASLTTIQQNSQNMAIDWQSYNLDVNERVQYIQPNSSSLSLNNILSNSASTIRGKIDANGQQTDTQHQPRNSSGKQPRACHRDNNGHRDCSARPGFG